MSKNREPIESPTRFIVYIKHNTYAVNINIYYGVVLQNRPKTFLIRDFPIYHNTLKSETDILDYARKDVCTTTLRKDKNQYKLFTGYDEMKALVVKLLEVEADFSNDYAEVRKLLVPIISNRNEILRQLFCMQGKEMKYHYGQKIEYLSHDIRGYCWKPGTYHHRCNGVHYIVAESDKKKRRRIDADIRVVKDEKVQQDQTNDLSHTTKVR